MKNGKRVGFTASCFDLFHAGHIMMLRDAKEVCDYLIVGIQTDPTLDRPDKNVPIQSIFERFVQVSGCRYVDEVVVYATERDLLEILQSYPIDIRILGEEYKGNHFTGHWLQTMEYHYNPRRHSFSTSALRRRVVQLEQWKQAELEAAQKAATILDDTPPESQK